MKRFSKLVSLTLQGLLYYKAAFLINLLTPGVLLAGQFMLWSSLFRLNEGGTIGDFTRGGMYSYIIIAFFVNNLLTWSSENNLSREIRSGSVTARCIRPVPFIVQSLAGMTGNMLPQTVVNGVIVVVLFLLFSQSVVIPSTAMLPAALVSLLLGLLLRMMLVSCFSLLCFYTTSHLGLTWARTALTEFFSGALIPIALFPDWLRTISYCTPFPLMLQVPVALLLGQPLPLSLPVLLGMQAVWTLLFLSLHQILYERIRKNMVLAGG